MQLSFDTNSLSDLDRAILAVLSGGPVTVPALAVAGEPAPAKPAPAKPAPAKPEPKAKPAPAKPEPEPMAEEEIPEEPGVEDEPSAEDLLDLAVKKATEMVASGGATKVRDALDAAGANRVRELNKDNVREFFKALS